MAKDGDVALVREKKGGDAAHQGGLARAVGTQDAKYLSAPNLETDAVHGHDRLAAVIVPLPGPWEPIAFDKSLGDARDF
jgi:hypothetical protein